MLLWKTNKLTNLTCRLVREDDPWAAGEDFLREVLLTSFERRRFQTEVINAMPLYPTEAVLWDENQVPSTHYTGGRGGQCCMCPVPDVPAVIRASAPHGGSAVGRDPGAEHQLHRHRHPLWQGMTPYLRCASMAVPACYVPSDSSSL